MPKSLQDQQSSCYHSVLGINAEPGLFMVNWSITATTIYCEAVDDEVTLMVYKDRSAKCTGLKKYGNPGTETTKRIKEKGKRTKRTLKCDGEQCARVTQYREKLFTEETGSK
jgi:hypothetical protein